MYGNRLDSCWCGIWYWKEIARTVDQPRGYSYGKGFLGALVFGPAGAVAGGGGKKTHTVTYKCIGCGRTKEIVYDKNGNYSK